MKVTTKERDVCRKIFDIVDKPKNYLFCKSMNVFDNKYRVNVYSKRYVNEIEGQYISNSYFVRYNEENMTLDILS